MQVLLIAAPGYYRDCLVALLRTIPELEVACGDGGLVIEEMVLVHAPDLVIVDRELIANSLSIVREQWPSTRILMLVDRFKLKPEVHLGAFDGILPKCLSAGEFLGSVLSGLDGSLLIDRQGVRMPAQVEAC